MSAQAAGPRQQMVQPQMPPQQGGPPGPSASQQLQQQMQMLAQLQQQQGGQQGGVAGQAVMGGGMAAGGNMAGVKPQADEDALAELRGQMQSACAPLVGESSFFDGGFYSGFWSRDAPPLRRRSAGQGWGVGRRVGFLRPLPAMGHTVQQLRRGGGREGGRGGGRGGGQEGAGRAGGSPVDLDWCPASAR